MPAWNGVTPSGQIMPLSSWLASMIAPDEARHADGRVEPMWTGTGRPPRRRPWPPHRLGILGAEIEDLAHLDAARLAAALFGHAGVEFGPRHGCHRCGRSAR